MIRMMRRADVANGKLPEAMSWAKEISATMQKRHGGPAANVFIQMFSGGGSIFWVADHESLASFEVQNKKTLADPDYWAAIKKAVDAGLFVQGSVQDTVLQQI